MITRYGCVQSPKSTKNLNTYLVMPHKKFGEDFVLKVTRDSCFNLALIQPDHKLSITSFA